MISDHALLTLRLLIIVLACGSAGLLAWFSWLARHDLSFWQGLTRGSLIGLILSVAFATVSSLARWDPDLRVVLLAVSIGGLFTGLVGTAVDNWRDARRPPLIHHAHWKDIP